MRNGKDKFLWVSILLISVAGPSHGFAATLSGQVTYEGIIGDDPSVLLKADPACALYHPEGISPGELIVSEGAGLANAFVYIEEGAPADISPVKDPIVLDQKGCVYEPHVVGLRVGQPLEILNSDDTLHNVRTLSQENKRFNVGMPVKGMKVIKKFNATEIMVKVKCDVHPWMCAYIGVLPHGYFSVSDREGQYQISHLPVGEYMLAAWHEKCGVLKKTFRITRPREDVRINLSYSDHSR